MANTLRSKPNVTGYVFFPFYRPPPIFGRRVTPATLERGRWRVSLTREGQDFFYTAPSPVLDRPASYLRMQGSCRIHTYRSCTFSAIAFTTLVLIGVMVMHTYQDHTITRHGIHKLIKEGSVDRAHLTEPYSVGKAPKRRRPVVPRLVHYVWPNSTKRPNFRFHHLISVLSAHKHIRPKEIWFWFEGQEPRGEYWQEAKSKVPIIKLVRRTFPKSIFGHVMNVEEHVTDIVRMEAIMKHGGIYLDLDVVAVKSFDPLLRYDVTLGYEIPTGLCNGVMIARPNASFMKIWYEHYQTFDDKQWGHHSVLLPATLAQKYPDLIHTEPDSLHSPGYLERKDYMYGDKFWDWSNNYACHLYYRFYNKDHTPEDIKQLSSTLGRLFRYIYYGSEGTLRTWNEIFRRKENENKSKT